MSRLRTNILALSAVQAGNFIFPLLVVPFLARTLGVDSYGKFAYAQSLMLFLSVITDFGFSLSATNEIAKHQKDALKVTDIFSANWALQWIITVVTGSLLIVWLLITGSPNIHLYTSGLLILIANTAFPAWYFQGIELLGKPAIINVLLRFASLPVLFIAVRTKDDADAALVVIGGAQLLGGVLVFLWARTQGHMQWRMPRFQAIKDSAAAGSGFFVSRIAVSFYTTLSPIILGWTSDSRQVAFFSLADRIRSAVTAMLSPISKALFPRMSNLYSHDPRAAESLLKRSFLWMGVLTFGLSSTLAAFAPTIIGLLAGPDYASSANVLRVMSALPFLVALSTVAGVQAMIPAGKHRAFTGIILIASVLSLITAPVTSSHFGALGSAATLVYTELFVTVAMVVYTWKSGLLTGKYLKAT